MSNVVCALSLALACLPASAATVCQFVTGGGINFGLYDTMSPAPADSALNVVVSCSRNGGPQFVTIDVGIGPGTYGSSASSRRMLHTGPYSDYLAYGLYRDAGRGSPWGYSPGVDTVAIPLAIPNKSSVSTTLTVYGRIPALQDVSVGSYGDAVQITVTP